MVSCSCVGGSQPSRIPDNNIVEITMIVEAVAVLVLLGWLLSFYSVTIGTTSDLLSFPRESCVEARRKSPFSLLFFLLQRALGTEYYLP
jgi:hypothetical protein